MFFDRSATQPLVGAVGFSRPDLGSRAYFGELLKEVDGNREDGVSFSILDEGSKLRRREARLKRASHSSAGSCGVLRPVAARRAIESGHGSILVNCRKRRASTLPRRGRGRRCSG